MITVHDYVTAVHPWLSQREDDIWRALGIYEPVPPHIELFVSFRMPSPLITIAPARHQDPAEFFEEEWRKRANVARRTRDGLLYPPQRPAGS